MITKPMQNLKSSVHHHGSRLAALITLGSLAACITVNVNFPESAVQRAADDFVRDLYKSSENKVADASKENIDKDASDVKENVRGNKTPVKKKPIKAPASEAPKAPNNEHTSFNLFDAIIPSAHAVELIMDSPKEQQIQARMASRVEKLKSLKEKGVICETPDAMIRIKDPKKATDISSVSSLVEKENQDREDLYNEVQKTNHLNDDRKQTKIRARFANSFKQVTPASGICDN